MRVCLVYLPFDICSGFSYLNLAQLAKRCHLLSIAFLPPPAYDSSQPDPTLSQFIRQAINMTLDFHSEEDGRLLSVFCATKPV